MNILAINPFQLNIREKQAQKMPVTPRFGLVMTKPLAMDTVSFGATEKMLTNRAGGVSLKTARKIHAEADILQADIKEFFDKFFKDLVFSKDNPNGIIEFIKGRTKTPESIVEKSATRDWTSMNEIFTFMTDLNGFKIVLRDGSTKNVKQILKKFEKAIESGVLICTEIENKCPMASKKLKGKEAEKWNYATYDTLENFYNFAKKNNNKDLKFNPRDYTESNYPAIHFLFRFPGQKRSFEVQLMGHNVSTFKDMDDIIFKILNNKNVDKAYQPMVEILEELKVDEQRDFLKLAHEQLKELNLSIKDERNTPERKEMLQKRLAALKEEIEKAKKKIKISEDFQKYRADAFLFQREKARLSYNTNEPESFLPLKYDLPQKYKFDNLYKLYLKCEAKKKKAKAKK